MKQARHESGLSLAQLGKGQVTAPAIYLIETGKTRPSLPTLEHIAHRTGKPLEFFLADPGGAADETQSALVELETLVADGSNAEALALGQRLLDQGASAHRLGRIRFLLGLAYIRSEEPTKAQSMLVEANSHFEAVGDDLMIAECLAAQAHVATLTHSAEAIPLAQKALGHCRALTPTPAPLEARILGILANALVGHQEWDKAIAVYQEAIASASSLFDLRRTARMYGRLSAAYRKSGQVEAANRFASRSVALLEVLAARNCLARSENAMGMILMTRGQAADAQVHLDRSVELNEATNVEAGSSHVLLSLCGLALQEGSPQQAADFARQALELAERYHDRLDIAEAHVLLSRVAEKMGDDKTVDREFELAIQGLEQLGMRDRLLQCHGDYAEILERRGELSKAYAHMKKAVQASRPGVLAEEDDEERTGTA